MLGPEGPGGPGSRGGRHGAHTLGTLALSAYCSAMLGHQTAATARGVALQRRGRGTKAQWRQ